MGGSRRRGDSGERCKAESNKAVLRLFMRFERVGHAKVCIQTDGQPKQNPQQASKDSRAVHKISGLRISILVPGASAIAVQADHGQCSAYMCATETPSNKEVGKCICRRMDSRSRGRGSRKVRAQLKHVEALS